MPRKTARTIQLYVKHFECFMFTETLSKRLFEKISFVPDRSLLLRLLMEARRGRKQKSTDAVFPLPGPLAARSQPAQSIFLCQEKFLSSVPDYLFWQSSAEPHFRCTCFLEPAHTGPSTKDRKHQGPRTED